MQAKIRKFSGQRGLRSALILWFTGTAWLAGCTQPVRVDGAWQEEVPRTAPFSRILVVAVTPDFNQRCAFEGFMVRHLRSDATDAMQSCRSSSPDEPLSRETIERAIAEHEADAVLATRLVAGDIEGREGGDAETRGDAYYKATGYGYDSFYYGGWGMWGVPVVYGEFRTAPPITTVEGEVEIATMLYDARDASLVYQMETTARDLRSRVAALAELTGPMAERLRRDGVIR